MKDELEEAKQNPFRALGVILAGGGLIGLGLPHGIGFWIMVAGGVILAVSTQLPG